MAHLTQTSINFSTSRSSPHAHLNPPPSHLSPVLHNLPWLPFQFRINFKVLLTTYKVLNNLAPPYLSDLLHLHTSTHCLRSTDTHTHTQNPQDQALHLGLQGLLSHSLWNSLPDHNRPAKTLPSVKPSKPTSLRTLSPQNFLSFPPLSSFLILFYFLLNLYLTR